MAPAQGWHAKSWSVPHFLSIQWVVIETVSLLATLPIVYILLSMYSLWQVVECADSWPWLASWVCLGRKRPYCNGALRISWASCGIIETTWELEFSGFSCACCGGMMPHCSWNFWVSAEQKGGMVRPCFLALSELAINSKLYFNYIFILISKSNFKWSTAYVRYFKSFGPKAVYIWDYFVIS